MNETIDEVTKRIKNKRLRLTINDNAGVDQEKSYMSRLLTRILITIIFLLTSVIFINSSNSNLLLYKEHVMNTNFSFGKINSLYQKYFGDVIPLSGVLDDNSKAVFNEVLIYKNSEKYENGLKLTVDINYAIPVITSGIVVFVGEKEALGNTIIVQGIDGVDIWYSNIRNSNVTLYDYIEQGSLLGEVEDNYLYLTLQKDGEYINYEKYSQ